MQGLHVIFATAPASLHKTGPFVPLPFLAIVPCSLQRSEAAHPVVHWLLVSKAYPTCPTVQIGDPLKSSVSMAGGLCSRWLLHIHSQPGKSLRPFQCRCAQAVGAVPPRLCFQLAPPSLAGPMHGGVRVR